MVPAKGRHNVDITSFRMSDLLYIAGAIALLALAALFVYVIFFLRQTKELIIGANRTLNDISGQINLQLQNVDGIVKNVGKLTDDLTDVVDDATAIIHEGRVVVVSLLELEQTLQKSIQAPIVEIVSVFGALGKGIKAFRKRLSGGSKEEESEEDRRNEFSRNLVPHRDGVPMMEEVG